LGDPDQVLRVLCHHESFLDSHGAGVPHMIASVGPRALGHPSDSFREFYDPFNWTGPSRMGSPHPFQLLGHLHRLLPGGPRLGCPSGNG
jgi:hypothetical protein